MELQHFCQSKNRCTNYFCVHVFNFGCIAKQFAKLLTVFQVSFYAFFFFLLCSHGNRKCTYFFKKKSLPRISDTLSLNCFFLFLSYKSSKHNKPLHQILTGAHEPTLALFQSCEVDFNLKSYFRMLRFGHIFQKYKLSRFKAKISDLYWDMDCPLFF